MYRVGIEHILGLKVLGDKIQVDPCIPRDWRQYRITYTIGKTPYKIIVKNPYGISKGVKEVYLDGNLVDGEIPLVDDQKQHDVTVVMGE